jgi:hypothetical protein
MSRWSEAVSTVGARFQDLHALPLEEAVEVAAMRTPGSFSREELARRMAATASATPSRGWTPAAKDPDAAAGVQKSLSGSRETDVSV